MNRVWRLIRMSLQATFILVALPALMTSTSSSQPLRTEPTPSAPSTPSASSPAWRGSPGDVRGGGAKAGVIGSFGATSAPGEISPKASARRAALGLVSVGAIDALAVAVFPSPSLLDAALRPLDDTWAELVIPRLAPPPKPKAPDQRRPDRSPLEMSTEPETAGGEIRSIAQRQSGLASMRGWDGMVPPILARLEEPLTKTKAESCQAAVVGVRPHWFSSFSSCQGSTKEARQACEKALAAYVRDCLVPWSDDKKIQVEASRARITPSMLQAMAAATGVLYLTGADGRILCTAVAVGRSLILTARHCLFPERQGSRPYDLTSIKFLPLTSPTQMIAIRSEPRFSRAVFNPDFLEEEQTLDDWVLLSIAEPAPGVAEIAADPPPLLTGLATIAFQDDLLTDAEVRTRQGSSPATVSLDAPIQNGSWVSYLQFEPSPTCSVIRTSGQCLVHACQTGKGSSGAPLFRIDHSGRVNLVGMHLRARIAGEQARCFELAYDAAPNIGLVVHKQHEIALSIGRITSSAPR